MIEDDYVVGKLYGAKETKGRLGIFY